MDMVRERLRTGLDHESASTPADTAWLDVAAASGFGGVETSLFDLGQEFDEVLAAEKRGARGRAQRESD